jgi:hypothetical protein
MGQRFTITESERNRIKGLYEEVKPTLGKPIKPIQIKIGELLVTLTTMDKSPLGGKFYGHIRGFEKGSQQEVFFACGDNHVQMKEVGNNNVTYKKMTISPEGSKLLTQVAGCNSYVKNQEAPSDMV